MVNDVAHEFRKIKNIKMEGLVRTVCAGMLFLFVFCFLWQSQKNCQSGNYLLSRDSPTYVEFNAWKHPCQSGRTIGYPAFIYPFLYPDQYRFIKACNDARRGGINIWASPEAPIYAIASEIGIAKKFEAIVLAQRLILSLAIAIFYLSLCRWFRPISSLIVFYIALWMASLPNPYIIMTEPLSCAFTWLCGACLLFAPTSRRKYLYYMLACLCASFAFLVRPQTLSLTGLCSLILIYEVFFSEKPWSIHALFKKAATFSPLLLAYGYIAWISVSGGGLHLHTLVEVYNSAFCTYAEAEDANYMPTERSREFTKWFGEHKEELIHTMKNKGNSISPDASPPHARQFIGDGLLYRGGMAVEFYKLAMKNDTPPRIRLRQAIFARELMSGLKKRHASEMIVGSWQNFLGGLGYYKDIYTLPHFPGATLIINMGALVLAVVGAVTGVRIRWPLTIMAGIHLMALLAAAFGHFVIARYVEPTEPFLLLAGMYGFLVLSKKIFTIQKPQSAN